MNAKVILVVIGLTIITVLCTSCGAPVATEPPALTEPSGAESSEDTPTAPTEPTVQINNVVVILVVDAFSSENINQNQEDPNCAVTADGQKFRGEGSTTVMLGEPHGIFVYKDLINQIEISEEFSPVSGEGLDFSGTQSLGNSGWIKRFDLYTFNQMTDEGLLVVAVDTDGFNLDLITQNISAAFEMFSGPNNLRLNEVDLPESSRFIVNMSFVLIPCDPNQVLIMNLEELKEQYGIEGTGDIVQELQAKYYSDSGFKEKIDAIPALNGLRSRLQSLEFADVVVDDAVFQALIVYLIYDPDLIRDWQYDNFYDTLADYFYNKGLEIVYVGAAGNFQDKFPYAPASWDFVDSISSGADEQEQNPIMLDNGLSLAEYSNWGEIQMDGVFPHDDRIVGTSFAAPRFSYEIARYLIDGGKSSCNKSSPALGYAATKDPWGTDSFGNDLVDNNLPFDQAMQNYCP